MDDTQTAPRVAVVVPAFNEENGIGDVLDELLAAVGGVPGLGEVIVVDDGSHDGTAAAAERDGVRVVRHESNRGYGAALKTGIAAADCDVVVITDADGTYPAGTIPELVARVAAGADMAVGARGRAQVALVRRPAKAFLRSLASFLAATPIPDLNSGLRAIRTDLVSSVQHMLPDGFSFTTTITLAALTSGRRVEYVSIDYRARVGRSKIRPFRDTAAFTGLVVRTVLTFRPMRIIAPLGGALTALFLASLSLDVWNRDLTDKTVLLLVAAVQVWTVGFLADLVDRRTGKG